MNKTKQSLGRLVYAVGWPVLWLYFRVWSKRSRVLVIFDRRILLVKGWLGNGSWCLPGGGARKNEPLVQSAVRELQEETGVVALPAHLEYLEDKKHLERWLRYTASYFKYLPKSQPKLIRQEREIAEIGWFSLDQIKQMKLNIETRYAVETLAKDLL